MITIRSADTHDLNEIKQVDDAAFGAHHGITMKELHKLIRHGRILVAVNNEGVIIGHNQVLYEAIQELPWRFTHPDAYCYGTAILPKHQGKGIGRLLAEKREKNALIRGVRRFILTVRPENYPSLSIWLKMGFVITGYDPFFYGSNAIQDGRFKMIKVLQGDTEEYSSTKRVTVKFGDAPDNKAREKITTLLSNGFIGVNVDHAGICFAR